MKSYGQFCPVAKAAELFCERWTPLILRDLATGVTRFSELRRGVPLASPTLLSRRLKQLEAEGIIERRRVSGTRHSSYHLTPAGAEFAPLVEALGVWGQRWARRELQKHEADLGLLIWALQRSVHAGNLRQGAHHCGASLSRSAQGEAALVVRERRWGGGSLPRTSGRRGRSLSHRVAQGHDPDLARRSSAQARHRRGPAAG